MNDNIAEEVKYYDWNKKRYITSSDCCQYEEFMASDLVNSNYSYAVHSDGFKVFVPSLTNAEDYSDEYAEGDPYSVDISESAFHKARVLATIHLIKSVRTSDSTFNLLDVACGKGYITNEISKEFPNAQITAFDYSIAAIRYAFNNFKGIDFSVADAYNQPYSKEYFDVIVLNNIWEHVPDPLHLLEQVKKTLKPDGVLIISTPSRYRLENMVRKILRMQIKFMSKLHVTEYSVGQVLEQLRYGGFETVQIYSRKNYKIESFLHFLAYIIIKPFFSFLPGYLNPSHCIESTCYFVAKRISAK